MTNFKRDYETNTIDELLAEIKQAVSANSKEYDVVLFRGHAEKSWVLDSTLTREIKKKIFGLRSGELPSERIASLKCFVDVLYGVLFFRFGGVNTPSRELIELENTDSGLDSWFELMRHFQQEPTKDQFSLKGTILMDWSKNLNVALYMACCESQFVDNPGVIYVHFPNKSGQVHSTHKLEEMLGVLAHHNWEEKAAPGLPMIYHPPIMTANEKVKNQEAVYIAQIDLRWPLETIWEKAETDSPIFLRFVIQPNQKAELLNYLDSIGINQEFLQWP